LRIDSATRVHVEDGEVLGLAWLVARGDDIRSGVVGHVDEARTRPVSPDTIFRISSMSKPLTGALTMTLVDDGSVALDDPVERWLPELADRRVLHDPRGPVDDTVRARRAITVEDLLTFRLGWGGDFTDWGGKPFDDAVAALDLGVGPPQPAVPPPPDEWMRRMGTLPLHDGPFEWPPHGLRPTRRAMERAAGSPRRRRGPRVDHRGLPLLRRHAASRR
jgi:CubicO group peptidase (beta-lactamase class C family)